MTLNYDIAVIGSGPGGYPAAIRAKNRGKKVALIEAGLIGGTCLNIGCIPSKSLIYCAEQFYHLKKEFLEPLGIETSDPKLNYAKMVERKDNIVTKMRKSLEGLLKGHGVDTIRGFARFLSSTKLEVELDGTRTTIEAKKIIIATGSQPKEIPAFPFDGKRIIDSTSFLDLKELPKKLVVIGGGVIGCECASLFNLLGVDVTIIEMLPSLLPMECSSIGQAFSTTIKKRGVKVFVNAKVTEVKNKGSSVSIKLESGEAIEGDIALVSVGRQMNFQKLNLESAGVKLKNPYQIDVNEAMETSIKGIYAVGDIASKWWLAHVATHQGLIAADNACGHPAQIHYNAVPNVIFTYPEIATVGLSLDEAKKAGYKASRDKFPFQALGKAQATGHTEGFTQIVSDDDTGAILGVQIFGDNASALIGEGVLAIQNELVVESITETIHPHPTLTEGMMESALLLSGLPLHLPPGLKQ
ncbi:MAG: dihydrolipoyl dehydrogenase [Parachlamydiaceae bacterium]